MTTQQDVRQKSKDRTLAWIKNEEHSKQELDQFAEQVKYDIECFTHRSKDPDMDTRMDAQYRLTVAEGELEALKEAKLA